MTSAIATAIAVKPFKDYPELVAILESRGMRVEDRDRACRKLSQVGYYRLSGYWHSSRRFRIDEGDAGKVRHNLDEFQAGTTFESVFRFYLMDKALRLLLCDALERIEVHLRTIIAHELGRHDPLAYLKHSYFTKKAFVASEGTSDHAQTVHANWLARHAKLIEQSREESICYHLRANKPIPIWVASEAWDFGLISKLYSILSVNVQDSICGRLGIAERNVVENWLINLNGVRNRCAHHARLCNRPNPRVIMLPRRGYFNDLQLNQRALGRFYGLVAMVWYLLKMIGPSSDWLCKVADVLDAMPKLPGLTDRSMGFPEGGFPREKFPLAVKRVIPSPKLDDVCASAITSLKQSKEAILSFPKDDVTSLATQKFSDDVLDLIADM